MPSSFRKAVAEHSPADRSDQSSDGAAKGGICGFDSKKLFAAKWRRIHRENCGKAILLLEFLLAC
jgi:hypothetical protein